MKHYTWREPFYDEEGNYRPIKMLCSEQDILESYWPQWKNAMVAKYGEGHELINKQTCIKIFVAVHRAVEVKNERV